jgi:hypothetical protein
VLHVLALPVFPAADGAWLDAIRTANDPAGAAMIAPHFTLVFGFAAPDPAMFGRHVAQVAGTTARIDFACHHALPWSDGAVFLVADEGNSAILALHDRLYAGPLAGELRLDLPYVPHITVGRFPTPAAAKACAARLNAGPVAIRGLIESVAVVLAAGGRAEVVATFPLTA